MNELQTYLDAVKSLTDIDEEMLTDDVLDQILNNLREQFSASLVAQSSNQIIRNMEEQGLTKEEGKQATEALKEALKEAVYGENVWAGNKKKLVDTVLEETFKIFDAAADKYHSFNIILPMKLEKGAQVPTYAHDTDAAADLYALEDTELNAHTYGNKIRTGVSIQLPEGWLAMILPRSSIGSKTPFRLSNSVGLIDSGYRGELGVLYDNTSDGNMSIKKGDRIAQLLVMPSYRFQAQVVDILESTDRGTGGFGSTGT